METWKQEEFFLVLQQDVILHYFDNDFFIYGRLEKQTTVKIYHVCQNECDLKLYHALRKLKVTYSPFQLECSCVNFFSYQCVRRRFVNISYFCTNMHNISISHNCEILIIYQKPNSFLLV